MRHHPRRDGVLTRVLRAPRVRARSVAGHHPVGVIPRPPRHRHAPAAELQLHVLERRRVTLGPPPPVAGVGQGPVTALGIPRELGELEVLRVDLREELLLLLLSQTRLSLRLGDTRGSLLGGSGLRLASCAFELLLPFLALDLLGILQGAGLFVPAVVRLVPVVLLRESAALGSHHLAVFLLLGEDGDRQVQRGFLVVGGPLLLLLATLRLRKRLSLRAWVDHVLVFRRDLDRDLRFLHRRGAATRPRLLALVATLVRVSLVLPAPLACSALRIGRVFHPVVGG
mmetsp:Transcript_6613/g.29882  ORF Transcript_6613/g.29882 Transcript_6613/m.29882 type:complete len:284 (+) Transcript_6613:153-1004(+)